ncbi:Beta-galactosidase [Acidisarcina polymorpha]|uniref:Beta-galactosidase n=1 Tax=Acidisarcina polymorpha TaxID=2211140 RepID=A0A2Z5FYE3_9BACT|nr:beta-galactosidase [Acidisarcina polymorpha]AXC11730.1 Beta-galactosidase [Acidisarcina polymorpha]
MPSLPTSANRRRSPRNWLAAAEILTALLLALLPSTTQAQATAYPNAPPLLLGAAWYPEQWPEAQWDRDLAKMEAAHIRLVRMGEFAWSTMEPEEGHYDFTWLDHAIAKAAAHHIVVVLGTPTAAPPAWLTTKYPETLRVDENGVRDEHGNRQQFSFINTKYRQLARGIAGEMAKRYGHNPNVVGWQLDNEYANDSFDPEAKAQFHEFLKKKYGSIQNLNQKWATTYWSQTYDSFDEIPVRPKNENPALLLDWRHFVSQGWKSYSVNQIEAIRPLADPRQFITTNTMGWFDNFDEYVVHTVLDMASWDDYISDPVYDPFDNGARHDLTRGYKRKNFWVMETEPAFVNWRKTNNPLDKGQVRDMAWQAIGHGSDAVEYWQWRAALNGQEQYHGVLVGADGNPVPVYDEVKQVGEEFEKAGAALAGTSPHAEVAILNDYNSRWAINFQRHSEKFDPVEELVAFYKPLSEAAQTVDIVSPDAPLDGYKLVEAPALNVLPKATAVRLVAYVQQGGNLLLGPRSGMKDEYDALNTQLQPGDLSNLLGGHVEQFYALENEVPVTADLGSGTAKIWAEQLSIPNIQVSGNSGDTKTILTYGPSNGWLDNQPAAITRKIGKGSITYLGVWLDDALLAKLTNQLVQQAGVQPKIPNVPAGVEVCVRSKGSHAVAILINHTTSEQHVTLPNAATDLLANGTPSVSSEDLPKYGVAVVEISK